MQILPGSVAHPILTTPECLELVELRLTDHTCTITLTHSALFFSALSIRGVGEQQTE